MKPETQPAARCSAHRMVSRRRDAKMDADGHCTVCGCEVRVYEGGEDNGLTNSELMRRHVCPPGFRQRTSNGRTKRGATAHEDA
jgi:hypothetical protein